MVDLNPFAIMEGLREALGNSYLTLHDFFIFLFSGKLSYLVTEMPSL